MRELFVYSMILCLLVPFEAQINSVVTNMYPSDQIELINVNSSVWLIEIGIGYPVQYFTVQVDTASPYLWVPNTSCKYCDITTKYNPKNQNDYQPNGKTFTLYYDEGAECSGIIATDQVSVSTTLINTTMTMYFATYETGFPEYTQFNGVMGLNNEQMFPNIFQIAYNNQQISSQLFGLAFNQMPTPSYLIYNNINAQILNNAVWIGNQVLEWGVDILTLTINEEDIQCPCSPTNPDTVPNLVFGLQGINITIPYANMLQQYYSSSATDTCQLAVGIGETALILGDPFFLSTIVLFNQITNEVGFYN